jgi:sugar phosphate isomerase/epimerase
VAPALSAELIAKVASGERGGRRGERVALFSACLPGWDAEPVVAAALSLGFHAIEWGVGPGQAMTRLDAGPRIARMCEDAGLAVAGLSVQDPAVTLATPRAAARYVKLAIGLGAPHVRFFAPPYDGRSLASQRRRVRAGLDSIVELGAPAGLGVLVETSPDTLAPTPSLAVSLVEHHPPRRAGVLYDPGNMAIEGHVSAPLAIALLGRHLRHVHVKNISWSRRHGAWKWRHAGLGAGVLDWPEILAALSAAGYGGRLSIDHLGGRPTLALLRSETGRLCHLIAETSG